MVDNGIKSIKIPSFCEDLAEETGIHIGDGCISILRGHSYFYTIALNSLDDIDYADHVINKMGKLYGLIPSIRVLSNQNTRFITFFSKKLIKFKNKMGLPIGSKENIEIPKWIFSNKKFIAACIRGIVDTDGTLVFKRKYWDSHTYPMIKVSGVSKILMEQLASLFLEFDINISFYEDKARNKRWKDCWCVQISGVNNLIKYIESIGFSNQKHIDKLKVWEKCGFCPPFTSTDERKLILKGKLNPYNFYKDGSSGI